MAAVLKIIRAAAWSLMLSRTSRDTLLAGLAGLARWIARPSTRAGANGLFSSLLKSRKAGGASGIFQNAFKGAEDLLLKYARRIGFSSSGALAISALAALLWAAMKEEGRDKNRGRGSSRPSDRVIEVDDFTVIGERRG
ncbi:MAG TPA: hypothetical protein PLN19_05785 [Methanothrix sp.]|nr:hypothetical protein [Methanothrix sp.]HOV82143.1 hypothetical protein [Methanothrix sp.]HPC89998.1 hypothetical protein [Methanothrix sp.]HQE87769.1 hypothetical protein [Methanothrix sp.]HQI68292.1 hypothetical protein [Methanothrix sp.]